MVLAGWDVWWASSSSATVSSTVSNSAVVGGAAAWPLSTSSAVVDGALTASAGRSNTALNALALRFASWAVTSLAASVGTVGHLAHVGLLARWVGAAHSAVSDLATETFA